MRRIDVLPLVALTLIALAFYAGASEIITGSSGEFEAVIEKTMKVGAGGQLEIQDVTGDIDLQAWDRENVQVQVELKMGVLTREEAEEIVSRIGEQITSVANQVLIRGLEGLKNVESHYLLQLPRTFNVRAHTLAGDISASGLRGELEANSLGGDIKLREHAGVVRVRSSGGDLDFQEISGSLHASTAGGDIDLSQIFGEADVQTSGGDIRLAGATKAATLRTAGGDIDIAEATDRVSAKTLGGDIQAKKCSGGGLSLETNGGDIDLSEMNCRVTASTQGGDISGSGFDGELAVRTSGGDIELGGVRAPVNAQSASGDIRLTVTLSDYSRPHSLDLNAVSGDIHLTLPARLPADITAEVRSSERQRALESYNIYSDFPLIQSGGDETGDGWLRSKGQINGGGDPIRLRTQRGDIHIKSR